MCVFVYLVRIHGGSHEEVACLREATNQKSLVWNARCVNIILRLHYISVLRKRLLSPFRPRMSALAVSVQQLSYSFRLEESMSELYSQCCGAAPLEDDPSFCSECREHVGFEELCVECEEPCLVDGVPFVPVLFYDNGTVAHFACVEIGGE